MSKRTALAVSQEFDAQAAREKELGLPVTVMVADTEYGKAKMELGFIDFVVRSQSKGQVVCTSASECRRGSTAGFSL